MPQQVVMQSVTVFRDGKRVKPPLGQAFDFTKEELEQIAAASPEALRDPKDESLPAAAVPAMTVGSINDAEGAAESARPSGPGPLELDGPTKPGTVVGSTGPTGEGAEAPEEKVKGKKVVPDRTGGL